MVTKKCLWKKKIECLCIICKSCNTEINMINIAYECSRKWQFNLNALKSRALEIDSNKRKSDSYYEWYLDNDPIPLQDTDNYLGIQWITSIILRSNQYCRKGNITFFALTYIAFTHLNSLTMAHVHNIEVRPSVLFWCERRDNLSAKDSQWLHVFQNPV